MTKVVPYYEDDYCTIYCGDCRDLDAWLSADVLVTDPPYGVSYVSNKRELPSRPVANDETTDARDAVLAAWGHRPALVFGSWKVRRPSAGVRQLLVWDKGDMPGMGDLSMPWGPAHEEVYVIGDGFTGKRRSNVLRFNTMTANDAARPDHPTPKPVELMAALIDYCPPGVIADPFLGSGSTAVACKALGRRCIGIELDERYCEIAARRLSGTGGGGAPQGVMFAT